MGWRVLYIEESEYLSLYLDNIKIVKNDNEILIPLSDIHTIILDNYKITLSVHLINALTKADVNFVVCDIDHLPKTIILPFQGNKLAFQMLNFQQNLNDSIKKNIQKFIVKNKIQNQLTLLEHFNKNEKQIFTLKRFKEEVEIGDETNREGLSAKIYFRELYGKEFIRFKEDVVNAGLNYGYAVLRSQITKVLIAKGLNTAIGFFHIGRENQFNLSDDFIEPFRPLIDYWVYLNLISEQVFKRQHRLDIVKFTTCNVYINNQKQTLFNAIKIYVERILYFCRNGNYNYMKEIIIRFDEL